MQSVDDACNPTITHGKGRSLSVVEVTSIFDLAKKIAVSSTAMTIAIRQWHMAIS